MRLRVVKLVFRGLGFWFRVLVYVCFGIIFSGVLGLVLFLPSVTILIWVLSDLGL